jgi:hypothetical protein
MDTKLCALTHPKESMTSMILRSKVKGQTGLKNILTTLHLENHLLDGHQTVYTKSMTSMILRS